MVYYPNQIKYDMGTGTPGADQTGAKIRMKEGFSSLMYPSQAFWVFPLGAKKASVGRGSEHKGNGWPSSALTCGGVDPPPLPDT
jgi:hypothetical protein